MTRLPHLPAALLTAAAMLAPAAAGAAAPLRLSCVIEMDRTGERVVHDVVLDLDRATVTDGPMTWSNGGPAEPIAFDNLVAFVRQDGSRVSWGNANRATGKTVSVITLDLAERSYSVSGIVSLSNAHGRCRFLDGSI